MLNCGPECGGTTASVSLLPVAPMIFLSGQQSGTCCPLQHCSMLRIRVPTPFMTIPIPGGASNALVIGSTMYVVGQQLAL